MSQTIEKTVLRYIFRIYFLSTLELSLVKIAQLTYSLKMELLSLENLSLLITICVCFSNSVIPKFVSFHLSLQAIKEPSISEDLRLELSIPQE